MTAGRAQARAGQRERSAPARGRLKSGAGGHSRLRIEACWQRRSARTAQFPWQVISVHRMPGDTTPGSSCVGRALRQRRVKALFATAAKAKAARLVLDGHRHLRLQPRVGAKRRHAQPVGVRRSWEPARGAGRRASAKAEGFAPTADADSAAAKAPRAATHRSRSTCPAGRTPPVRTGEARRRQRPSPP